ncbi:MAG: shikimate dehydrogenase [Planctomycetota bacterium]|nr:shikimate dehydrogenase [Planctomycetota bacterium]
MRELNFKQQLTGVFGQPVAENPTQAMIEAAYRHHGLEWRYLTIEVAPKDLADAVRGFRAMGFAGGNLTIPHKVAAIEHLDGLTDAAKKIEAVNCLFWRDGKLFGENTDGKGFVSSLREVADPAGKRVVILGAGGAARAIGVELALAGASEITIVNRDPQRGGELLKILTERTTARSRLVARQGDYRVPEGTDVVVNATSIGLFPDVEARVPLDVGTLTSNMVVADVIPNPPTTRFVRESRAKGCTVIDGLGMLVSQGVFGFKLWTGVEPEPHVMRQALEDVFAA